MPYLYGQTTADVNKTLDSFKNKGYLSVEYSQDHLGPDSSFVVMYVSSRTNTLFTRSWHEVCEQHTNIVALSDGITSLNGRIRADILKDDKPEYLQYRAMWADIRTQVSAITPQNGYIVDDVILKRTKYDLPPSIIWKK